MQVSVIPTPWSERVGVSRGSILRHVLIDRVHLPKERYSRNSVWRARILVGGHY
jgi:hypothetical protein